MVSEIQKVAETEPVREIQRTGGSISRERPALNALCSIVIEVEVRTSRNRRLNFVADPFESSVKSTVMSHAARQCGEPSI